MRKRTERENSLNDLNGGGLDSPIMPTRYAHRSAKLIRSIEKTFYPIIGLVAALFVFAILDITDIVSKYNILPDRTYDMIITFAAAILLIVVVYLLYGLIKSREMLHHWADIFEKNSIKAGLTIAMSNTSKEEVLRALSETIDGIGEPLKKYLSSNPERYKNLINVQIDKEIVFDILIDKDHLTTHPPPPNQVSSAELPLHTMTASSPDNEQTNIDILDLLESMKGYGSILAKVISGSISKESVKSFQEAIIKYTSLTKNKVALALIIGDGIEAEADSLSKLRIKGIDYLILIEK
jgi:hypothetical protein